MWTLVCRDQMWCFGSFFKVLKSQFLSNNILLLIFNKAKHFPGRAETWELLPRGLIHQTVSEYVVWLFLDFLCIVATNLTERSTCRGNSQGGTDMMIWNLDRTQGMTGAKGHERFQVTSSCPSWGCHGARLLLNWCSVARPYSQTVTETA